MWFSLKKYFCLFFCLLLSLWSTACQFETEETPDIPPIVEQEPMEPPVEEIDPPVEEKPVTPSVEDEWEDYGFDVIVVYKKDYSIFESGRYTSVEEVSIFLSLYQKLPKNYLKKEDFSRNDYTRENKLSIGGDIFYNREGILPRKNGRVYHECDIDYYGGSRNSKRIVFSNDHLIFYTNNHYESFSIIRVIL